MSKISKWMLFPVLALICVIVLILIFFAPKSPPNTTPSTHKGIVILHTNDIHCGVNATDTTMGYADLAAYRARLKKEGYTTVLVDNGDAIQGEIIGTLSNGSYIIDIMNALQYDLAVPGNHEFDFTMENFLEITKKAQFPYICANFVDLATSAPVLDTHHILEVDGIKLGFVGITTPETLTKSTPAFFKNDQDEYIYGFCSGNNGQELYATVQNAVDAAKAAGAQMVIAIGHLGIDTQSQPWTSREVIANTTGIDAFIDGHSHVLIDGEKVTNKNGEIVFLSSAQTKLSHIGAITITDGKISNATVISKSDFTLTDDTASEEYKAYTNIDTLIKNIEAQYQQQMDDIVASSQVNLLVNKEGTEERAIRRTETNLGDLCADAYRTVLNADIGFVNGGSIRASVSAGDITYSDIIAIYPFSNRACLIEVTGQQLLDALELGSAYTPEESGGFLQVSGLTYEIHTYLPSTVMLNNDKEFLGVSGEYRVRNVLVDGQPLELDKIYTLASNNYILKSKGDGYTMFEGSNLLQDEIMSDSQVLIDYIANSLNGQIGSDYANPAGQGRITIISATPAINTSSAPATSNLLVIVLGLAAIVFVVILVIQNKKCSS